MKKTVSLLFAFIIILSALCFSVSAEASSAGKCDINGDGSVDAADYIIVKRVVLRNTDIEGIEVSAADVNGALSIVFVIATALLIRSAGFDLSVASIASNALGTIIGSVVMIILNSIYYKKRAALFVNF